MHTNQELDYKDVRRLLARIVATTSERRQTRSEHRAMFLDHERNAGSYSTLEATANRTSSRHRIVFLDRTSNTLLDDSIRSYS